MLIAGNVENFKEYSNFKSLKEFNSHIEMFLAVHKKAFTKVEFMLFRRLTKYAAKVAGVANASIQALMNGVKEKDFVLGASESTFQRMKRKAIKLGILEVIPVTRKDGSQSANLWVFKRFGEQPQIEEEKTTIDTPRTEGEQPQAASQQGEVFRQLTPHKTSYLIKSSKHNIKKRKENAFTDSPVLDHSFVSDRVPAAFVAMVKPFFDDAKLIEEYWRMAVIDTYTIKDKLVSEDDIIQTAIAAFKQMIRKLKLGGVRNPVAYYVGVFKKKMDVVADLAVDAEIERLKNERRNNPEPIEYTYPLSWA